MTRATVQGGTELRSARLAPEVGDALDLLSIQLDRLLDTLPDSTLEARRQITRELHYEPRPEELQTIVKIAADDAVEGPRHALPRELLRTRLFVERELKRLLEMQPLEAEAIETSAATLPQILGEAQRLDAELRTLLSLDDVISREDRDYLMQMGDALEFDREDLLACSVLAARLAALTRAEAEGRLAEEAPDLEPAEIDCLRSLVDPDAEHRSSRANVDALAIRTLVESHLRAWAELGKPSEDDDDRRAARDALLERLESSRIALEFVARRVQDRQDSAIQAGLDAFAEELQRTGRSLFSVKLRLTPILREPYRDAADTDGAPLDGERLRSMLRESAADLVREEDRPKAPSEEELYLGALKGMRQQQEIVERKWESSRPSEAVRRKRRMRFLCATAGLLLVVSVVVNFVVLGNRRSAPEAPPLTEMAREVDATTVEPAGPMLFTQVGEWADADESERQRRVDVLAREANDNGFQSVIVINEFGEAAGVWNRGGPIGVTPER